MEINKNQRGEDRVNVTLTVRLDGATGLTRNVSAGGTCFEMDANYSVGSEISFIIEMEAFGAEIRVKCNGSIVRTQPLGKKIGVAVKLTEAVMEAAN